LERRIKYDIGKKYYRVHHSKLAIKQPAVTLKNRMPIF